MTADPVLLGPATIIDGVTYTDPRLPAPGGHGR
jgi:hypothetical protein